MKVPRQLRAEHLALFYKLQELQTVASPQIPVVRQPEKSGRLESTSAVPQSYKLQESQTVASPQIPVVRQPEKSGSLEHTSAVSQSYQLQDTETVASPQVHVGRQPEKSGSLEHTSSVSAVFCRGSDPARISRKFQQSRSRNILVANLIAAEFS